MKAKRAVKENLRKDSVKKKAEAIRKDRKVKPWVSKKVT